MMWAAGTGAGGLCGAFGRVRSPHIPGHPVRRSAAGCIHPFACPRRGRCAGGGSASKSGQAGAIRWAPCRRGAEGRITCGLAPGRGASRPGVYLAIGHPFWPAAIIGVTCAFTPLSTGALLRSTRARFMSGVSSCLTMGAFDQPVRRRHRHEPIPPVWRMFCRCSFRVGRVGEVAVCGCRSWWRVGRSGRWYAISKRRAFRALLPDLAHEIGHFEVTGGWPGG